MSFFENYVNRKVSLSDEVARLDFLANKEPYNQESVYDVFRKNFLTWKLRGTAVDLGDFMETSGLNYVIKNAKENKCTNLSDYLDLCEFFFTLTLECSEHLHNNKYSEAIIDNIKIVLDQLNYTYTNVYTKDKQIYFKCIEKDFKTSKAIEIVKDDDLIDKIFMYKHRSLKGNIYEKAIILSRLYMYYEGIEKIIRANNLDSLHKVISELSDKLNIRHKPKGKEELVIKDLTESELEKIYDELFDAYITAIVISDYHKSTKKQLEEIRKKFIQTDNENI